MKKVFLLLVVITFFNSCDAKKSKYPKELEKIFNVYGGVEVWKNVKTVSFSVSEKNFTFDKVSNKKVMNASNYSVGFNGEEYWYSKKSPIKNPKEYLKHIEKIFFIPFLLADEENVKIDKEKSTIIFSKGEFVFNPKTFKIEQFKSGESVIIYKDWQEKTGFLLPKSIEIDNQLNEFQSIILSQAIFDDRFYQKP